MNATQLSPRLSRASAGSNNRSSPIPSCGRTISVIAPRGQPPPGNNRSSAGKPLAIACVA